LILSVVDDFFSTPTAIIANAPPISPPIWAQLSIPVVLIPIIKLTTIIGIICDLIALLIPKIGNYVGMIIGIMFYPLYKWDITRKLRKIKKDNPNANEGQLLYVAKNKGGTSAIGAITFYVVYILIIVFINLFIYMIGGEY